MMLYVHKDKTDVLTLVDVANDFVGEKENRKQVFGKFSVNDILSKFSVSSKSTQMNGNLVTKQEILYTTVVI